MRLLDRYLVRELLVPLGYCLAGFLLFWISFDLFNNLDLLQRAELSLGEIVFYCAVRTPDLLVTVLPVALLLALLYAVTDHGRHNELLAMRAAGLSWGRICAPYMAAGLAGTGLLFALNEYVAPGSAEAAQAMVEGRGAAAEGEDDWTERVNFRNARANRIWNIGSFNLRTHEMASPHLEWTLENGVRKQLLAERAVRVDGQWQFENAEIFAYEPETDLEKFRPVKTNMFSSPQIDETPEEIALHLKFNRLNARDAAKRPRLSLREIAYLEEHLDLNERDRSLLATQYHARLAQPWTCLVVALIAFPFGMTAHSRRNAVVGVASSIFICFGYFVLLRIGLALGTGGMVAPWVAAWLPNGLFGGLGGWLMWRTR